jgi:non-specific serine/threonine protein kinase/serine/threonine-protein kinase
LAVDKDEIPPEDPEATRTSSPEGSLIRRMGNYRLLEKVGEGGMGEVYLAEQEKPIRRRVALKLIKAGMDTKQVIARFESERQALALMDHPSIAKVFDAGSTPEGRPYFAMEYVKGEPITRYCDRHRLTTPERLELFMKVCEGVQHAHQKGIIHRDLKASNVLVAIQNEKPVPKIIDFGVAKATEHRLTEQTVYTQLGVLIGTPEYMSPEQAEMTGLDVDTRTDVYSLGVLLYELLTGVLPFDPTGLRKAGFDEIRRKIREEEPSRPSTRVSTLGGEKATSLSAAHRVELPALRRQLKGDLDWITMKALEKDRTRRYQSATDLAADIERHLTSQPVLASPPSVAYRMGKFVRRHKVGVAAGVVVAVAVVLGIAGTTVGFVRAKQAEAQARQDAETAELTSDFLVGLFRVSNPRQARGNTITARELLDKGAERIEQELQNRPLVQARMMETIGDVYSSLGLHEEAEPLLKQAVSARRELLGNDHPLTLNSIHALGMAHVRADSFDDAEPLVREALDGRRRIHGDDHRGTLAATNTLALIYSAQGRLEEAEPLLVRLYERERRVLGEDHEITLLQQNNLGELYRRLGRLAEAESLNLQALEGRRRIIGNDHPSTLQSLESLGNVYRDQGRHEDAAEVYREAYEGRRRVLGESHPKTVSCVSSLIEVLLAADLPDDARPFTQQLIETLREAAEDQAADAVAKNAYAWLALTCEPSDVRDAESALRIALEANEMTDFANAGYLDTLALAYHRVGNSEKAIETQREAISLLPEGTDRSDYEKHLGEFEAAFRGKSE